MKRWFIWLGLPVLAFGCCGLLGLLSVFPFEVAFTLAFGWAQFLSRVIPQITVDWAGIETALICLVGLGVGLHYFCGWFYGQIGTNHSNQNSRKHWRLTWTTCLLSVVVLMFVAGVAAIGMVHQTVWLANSPESLIRYSGHISASARTVSTNNLKQIGFGIHYYEGKFKKLPPGAAFDVNGRALHGWQTLLLPYLEQDNIFKQINRKLPWNDPANQNPFQKIISIYLNPAANEESSPDGYGLSHYSGNVYVFGTDLPMRLDTSFPDGTSETIMAGEIAANFKPWGYPTNWRDPGLGLGHPDGFGNPGSKKYAVFLMADASVRSFTEGVNPEVLKALSLPSGRPKLPPGEE